MAAAGPAAAAAAEQDAGAASGPAGGSAPGPAAGEWSPLELAAARPLDFVLVAEFCELEGPKPLVSRAAEGSGLGRCA